jgi:hypothetical protein
MKTLILFLALIFISFIGYSQCTYSITENITITGGQSYYTFTTSGKYLRTLKTIHTNCDSIISTTLAITGSSTFTYGTISTTGLKTKDIELYKLYLVYCNKIVYDTVKIIGYATPIVQSGVYLTQNIVCSATNNYNPYRLKKWKNIPSTETRMPTLPTGKIANWSTIVYPCLQRKSSTTDFYSWYCKLIKYTVTENITINNGHIYNGHTISGQYTRNLKSILGADSTVITNLTVNTNTITYSYGTTPSTVKFEDKTLFGLYLTYCNTLVLDSVKIVGYSEPLVANNFNITQKIINTVSNNYNPYRFKKYKSIPSTETRLPILPTGKTISWTKVSYYVLQRKSSLDDYNASYKILPIFGPPPATIKIEDYALFNQYLIYCHRMVLDTTKIVGYKTIPLVPVTNSTGTWQTQNCVVNSRINYNQYRFRKYKNIPATETRLPALASGQAYYWISISYWSRQRKSTDIDFYSWYYNLPIKPL